jgi:organic radical activating enzyme
MASRGEITRGILQAWGRILTGRRPNLSIEITRECPLRCPGCYAYGDGHLGGDVTLRGLADYRGDELVHRFMSLIDQRRPLHVSIVGGEPLVRYRELSTILPMLADRDIHTQLVTSAVRPIPSEWRQLRRLQIVVSVDGLPLEHDQRRAPATYERILKHIAGHQITVHCTVTRQQARRDGYLEEFLRFWQANVDTRMIWVSLYTPQRAKFQQSVLLRQSVIASSRSFAGFARSRRSWKCSMVRSKPTRGRQLLQPSVHSHGPRNVYPPISSGALRRVSSAGIRTAPAAVASHRQVSRRSPATLWRAASGSVTYLTRPCWWATPSRAFAR